MTLFRTTLPAATLIGGAVLAAGSAWAEPIAGLYVGVGAGYNLLQDITTTVDALPGRTVGAGSPPVMANAPMRVNWAGGYALTGAVGWGFGNGLRMELEGSYRGNEQTHDGGQQSQLGLMGNVLYDINFGLNWVSPYVGVGAGYQAATWRNVSGSASGIDEGGGPTSIVANQTLGAFAYQFIAGLSFPVDSVPGLSVTLEYRYLNLAASRAYRAVGDTPLVSAMFPNNSTHVHAGDDANQSVLVGLRYAFDAPNIVAGTLERPPPAPTPVPVPAQAAAEMPARTYLVFFDWNSAALTPRAREVIAEAVRNSTHVPYTRIEVTGHADRTGPERVNMALSRRRAEVVAAELERSGVPSTVIDIHAAGDRHPLVPTAAGVRQPENRRVEIVYR